MLVMMESIQNRIVENGKRGKATWLYIDEFHVLLNSEYSEMCIRDRTLTVAADFQFM